MPEITRTTVSLRIIGDALDPDEITRLLGVNPINCARRGDIGHTTSGSKVVARSGSWLLKSDAPGDLGTQIAALLTKLPDDSAVWRDLSHRHRCDIFCGIFMQDTNEGTELQPQLLSMLGSRGLRLGIDIYHCSDLPIMTLDPI